MKSKFLRFGALCVMLFGLLQTAFSQGVLTIEISDTLNAPLSNLNVRITDEKGGTISYRTDADGRVINNNIAAGNYSYSFYYGDYNTGKFTIKNGEPTWVNLDYRRVVINFKDENGKPAAGNFVTLYKRNEDGTRTLVKQKTSEDNGACLFVVPEGNYTYVAADGKHNITVADKNINTTVSVSSKLVTYKTSFQFIKDGRPIKVFARDVYVRQNQNGYFQDFGIVLAHGTSQSNGAIEYQTTEGKISCPVGEFEYSVTTRDYGTLRGVFYVYNTSSQTNNIVPIEIPSETPGTDSDPNTPVIIKPDEKEPTVTLRVKVVTCSDSTPIPNIAVRYQLPGNGVSTFKSTNNNGIASFVLNPNVYNIIIPSDTLHNVNIQKDTMVTMCMDMDVQTQTQQVYFKFMYDNKEVFPQTIKSITINKIEGGSTMAYTTLYPKKDEETEQNKFSDPLVTTAGRYRYSFVINEYNETSRYDYFETIDERPTDTVLINFVVKYNVDIRVIKEDSTPSMGVYAVSYNGISDTWYTTKKTDNEGHLTIALEKGEYVFSAIDQTHTVKIDSDTTLYYVVPNTQNVYFKFLHDGEIVYPDIMNLTFYKGNSTMQYAFLSSTHYPDYEGMGAKYVFDKPAVLPTDTYTVKYYIDDYFYDGQVSHKFTTNASTGNDTLIYIVVPVKRTVEIQIKDANGANVQGVFATIYKYNEDGTLSYDTDYDGNDHERLMSDGNGFVKDHLIPGRYQIRILDIVRDFEVDDYDLRFTILANVEMFKVKFKVLYRDDKTPVPGLKLDVKKGKEFYNSAFTNNLGEIDMQSEAASYSYTLDFGKGITGEYKLTKDAEIEILLDRPVLVNTIALFGSDCVKWGESVQFTALITPTNATTQDLVYSIDNNVLAKITSNGMFTANTIGESGEVTVTAKAKDESGVTATYVVKVGDGNCERAYSLAFGDGSTEMMLDDYTFKLVLTPMNPNPSESYRFLTSRDGVNWRGMISHTTETEMNVPSNTYPDEFMGLAVCSDTSFMYGIHLFKAIVLDESLAETNVIVLKNPDRSNGEAIADKIEIPTVFTPHEKNGANDDFMPGYPVVIYNRFGDVISKSDNGWDGNYKGATADAGVYIYVLTLKDGREVKGTIQVYRK